MARKPRIDAAAMQAALKTLGWSDIVAAEELGVASRARIWEWRKGKRPIPQYVAISLAHRLDQYLKRRGL